MNASRRFLISVLPLAMLLAVGCSTRTFGGHPGTGDDGGTGGDSSTGGDGSTSGHDGSVHDGGLHDLGNLNQCGAGCGPTELCGDTGHGNGLDDNCNGTVDEGCMCGSTGLTMPCFAGPPDRRNVGACSDGIETCTEFLTWSSCVGGHNPVTETCNGLDDDCDGLIDNGLSGCRSTLTCPATQHSLPLSTYNLQGEMVFGGDAGNWAWTIGCPASVPASLCPAPMAATSKDTSVYFTASGAYRVSVSFTPTGASTPQSCAWTVYVAGNGLRVELNWDTLGAPNYTDLDLHLHHWTQANTDTDFYTQDDCYYGNCTAQNYAGPFGGFGGTATWTELSSSAVTNCDSAPHGNGALWTTYGSCPNPRLDVDTNGGSNCDSSVTDPTSGSFCAPENINVDDPVLGMPYRIMVDYFSDHGYSGRNNPTVNVYCAGALRGTFGTDPPIYLNMGSSDEVSNDNWMVADVVFSMGSCGIDCTLYPLGMIAHGSGGSSLPFSPPWSCNYDSSTHSCH